MRFLLAACALGSLVGSAVQLPAQTLQPRPPSVGYTAPNPALSLPKDTKLMVRLDQQLDSSSAILGQSWTGTLVNDIPIGNRVALKSGTPVDGLVVGVKRGGHFRDGGNLSLRVIRVNGAAVATDVLTRDKEGHWKAGTKIGGGTVVGAAIGGLTGGVTGAVVGGAVGATTGTIAATTGGKKGAAIPTEAVLTFTVE
ncbi:MAG TPA: hypothetical protein VGM02_16550 [Acidobacteriaceae bacterium]|jgi:hypothetical protein